MIKRSLPFNFSLTLLVATTVVMICVVIWTWTRPYWQAVRRFSAVMNVIHEEYVDPGRVDYDRLATAAIDGMMESLDAYSRYMPADDFAHFEELTNQEYVGIGVQIERFGEHVTIVNCFAHGPAAEAGLLPGDYFVGVNGEDVSAEELVGVSNRLKGAAGESARVEVVRPSNGERLQFELTRRVVDLASVEEVSLDEDRIGYLRITQFGERTAEEFRAALDDLEGEGMAGLIIDLRDNPGGLLTVSKEVAGEFFQRGETIVFTEGRERIDRQDYRSDTPSRLRVYPIVVLINGQSASGAEIVAGALQDTGKAHIVGETSYGKGSVQSIYAFRSGAGLRQTTALYYLPSGRSINETGIVPDEAVKVSEEAAYRLALQKRHGAVFSPEEFEERFGFAPNIVDEQLEAGRRYLREAILLARAKKA